MRVLLINKYFYRKGGADAHAIDLQRLLEQRNHETSFFGMRHPRNLPTEDERFFVSEVDYRDPRLLKRGHAALRMLYNLEARSRIRELLDARRPQIAHLHNIYHQISPSILPLLRERGLPIVLSVHDLKLVCPSYSMLAQGAPCERCLDGRFYHAATTRCYENSVLKGAWLALEMRLHRWLGLYRDNVDTYLCPSRFYRDKLQQGGVPAERIRVLPYFLDATGYAAAGRPGSGVVYFGRLSREKGVATLIRAVSELRNLRLTVVGEGPLREELERLAAPLGARVQFTGYLSGDALHDAVRSAALTVVPSEWYENYPVSILESYALGRPVVAADIGGLPELVRPGETGWLFESGNVESLAATLNEATHSPDLESIARRCRERVEQVNSPDRFLEQLGEVYDR